MPRHVTRLATRPFPPRLAGPLLQALEDAHGDAPFGPADVREAARRVVAVGRSLRLEPVVWRGSVDLDGVSLDHVFVVVDDRVVDVALPLAADAFRSLLRAWVAGDVGADALDAAARDHGLEERVVGVVPGGVAYRGAPVWGQAA